MTNVVKEILKTLEAMAEVFAEKNILKYMTLYSQNSDIVIYGAMTGEKWTNIDDYRKSVAKNWEHAPGMKVKYNDTIVNYFGNTAWIATDIVFITQTSEKLMNIPGRFTAVLTLEKDKWKFVQTHFSMEMKPPQQ
ncbi:MAG: nuclear transport factor 2 family protein [Candidatus Heimdallarchaeota archaeon]